MWPPDDRRRLQHMLDHAREALELVSGKQRDDLQSSRVLSLALVRLMEIVGEAAARVTPETRDRLPQIPWVGIVGLRNRLVHGYDAVDLDILWTILVSELPVLVEELQRSGEWEGGR